MHARAQAQGLEDSATLAVDFNHLQAFDEELAGVVAREYYRVEPALRKARRAMHHASWRGRCMQDPDMLGARSTSARMAPNQCCLR